jgi:hypothetical protein
MLVSRKLPSVPVVADIPLFLISINAPEMAKPSEFTILPWRRMSLAMHTPAIANKMKTIFMLVISFSLFG